MEEDDGFGLWIGGLLEIIDVGVWAQITDASGTWRGRNLMAIEAGGDFAVVTSADAGWLTLGKGPPMTSRGGAQDGAFFGKRLGLGRLWGVARSRWIAGWLTRSRRWESNGWPLRVRGWNRP